MDASFAVYGALLATALFVWFAILGFLMGTLGPWRKLAAVHRAERSPESPPLGRQYAMFGRVRYNGVLRFAFETAGLHVSIHPLFRLGHPPLLIPWSAFPSIRRKDKKPDSLAVETEPGVALELSARHEEELRRRTGLTGDTPVSREAE